jgi:hypothetical protein
MMMCVRDPAAGGDMDKFSFGAQAVHLVVWYEAFFSDCGVSSPPVGSQPGAASDSKGTIKVQIMAESVFYPVP